MVRGERCSRLRGLVDQDGLQAKRAPVRHRAASEAPRAAPSEPTRFASRNLQVRSRSEAKPRSHRCGRCSDLRLLKDAFAEQTLEGCENDRAHGLLAAWLKAQSRNCCARVRCADNSHTLVAKAIVIPNFKHSWACLGGAKSRRPKRP